LRPPEQLKGRFVSSQPADRNSTEAHPHLFQHHSVYHSPCIDMPGNGMRISRPLILSSALIEWTTLSISLMRLYPEDGIIYVITDSSACTHCCPEVLQGCRVIATSSTRYRTSMPTLFRASHLFYLDFIFFRKLFPQEYPPGNSSLDYCSDSARLPKTRGVSLLCHDCKNRKAAYRTGPPGHISSCCGKACRG